MDRIPTPKKLLEIIKRLTPEERKLIEARIIEVVAKHRRANFKLVSGGRRKKIVTERMNALAYEFAGLKPEDPRRTEIIKEMSQLSLHSAWAKGQTTDG